MRDSEFNICKIDTNNGKTVYALPIQDLSWKKIKDEINKYTGDDATLVIAVFGFDSFSELKAFYYSRYKLVKNK